MIELVDVRALHPRGGAPLLDGADLAIIPGDVVLLGAPASAGASRLLRAILGEHAVDGGRIELFGRDLARLRRSSLLRLRRRIGVVPEDLRLLPDATALTNVLLPLDIDHVPRKEASLRAAEALARLGLAAEIDIPVERLSMAERQRVAIARAVVRTPPILLADQPTCHQDAEHALLIAGVFTELAATGTTILIASRDPVLWGLAYDHGWRSVLLSGGRIVDAAAPIVIEADEPPIVAVSETDVLDSAPIGVGETADAIPNVLPFPISARSRGVG
jgi:cell division transport system ATP-binding protein